MMKFYSLSFHSIVSFHCIYLCRIPIFFSLLQRKRRNINLEDCMRSGRWKNKRWTQNVLGSLIISKWKRSFVNSELPFKWFDIVFCSPLILFVPLWTHCFWCHHNSSAIMLFSLCPKVARLTFPLDKYVPNDLFFFLSFVHFSWKFVSSFFLYFLCCVQHVNIWVFLSSFEQTKRCE